MTFPDFSKDKGFNAVFAKIGATPLPEVLKLGHDTELTHDEMNLFRTGLPIKITEINPYHDQTLTYRAYRVFVYSRSTTWSLVLAKFFYQTHYYHFTNCALIKKNLNKRSNNWMMYGGETNLFDISKNISLSYIKASFKSKHTQALKSSGILIGYSPCPYCLKILDWEKYQSSKKKQKKAIAKSFCPKLFYSRYAFFIKKQTIDHIQNKIIT